MIKIGGSSTKFVTIDKFLTHKGMIFTVPSTLYTINGSRVFFKDQEINDFIEGQKGLTNCDAESDNEESNANEGATMDFVAERVSVDLPGPSSLKRPHLDNDDPIIASKKEMVQVMNEGECSSLMRGDCVKIISGIDIGRCAMITTEQDGLYEINFFMLSYGKYVLQENAMAHRVASNLQSVKFTFDNRSRYTFRE